MTVSDVCRYGRNLATASGQAEVLRATIGVLLEATGTDRALVIRAHEGIWFIEAMGVRENGAGETGMHAPLAGSNLLCVDLVGDVIR